MYRCDVLYRCVFSEQEDVKYFGAVRRDAPGRVSTRSRIKVRPRVVARANTAAAATAARDGLCEICRQTVAVVASFGESPRVNLRALHERYRDRILDLRHWQPAEIFHFDTVRGPTCTHARARALSNYRNPLADLQQVCAHARG